MFGSFPLFSSAFIYFLLLLISHVNSARLRHNMSDVFQDIILHKHIFSCLDSNSAKTVVELGALNGKISSNSNFFEEELHWRAILIEPSPIQFKQLQKNRPKATTINAAIANYSGMDNFIIFNHVALNGLEKYLDRDKLKRHGAVERERIPIVVKSLGAIFDENNVNSVDFLSLDVEGAELEVLQTIDLDKTPVDVMLIEGEDLVLRQYLEEKGYVHLGNLAWDTVFIKQASSYLCGRSTEHLTAELRTRALELYKECHTSACRDAAVVTRYGRACRSCLRPYKQAQRK
jgi:FkbM family methyltransferase